MSDMNGAKALALESLSKKLSLNYVRFDYFGHGKSSGDFLDCTISTWKENALCVLDNLTKGPQIIVGSSMGGWLMLLLALARPERIAGLVGVAIAPDFTEKLIWNQLKADEKTELTNQGIFYLHSDYGDEPYPITIDLIEDGRKHLILDKPIAIKKPIRLLHGMLDNDVPSELSAQVKDLVTSNDITVNLIADGDHRMSSEQNIMILCRTVQDMVEKYKETI